MAAPHFTPPVFRGSRDLNKSSHSAHQHKEAKPRKMWQQLEVPSDGSLFSVRPQSLQSARNPCVA